MLHYLYFYFMNDYRSTFHGANDHEADWEQSFVYLEDAPDGPRPVWIAGAAHDYSGDELRRRWDDPILVREGDHPVIYAGAGSHAAYFEQGEYLTAAPLPAARGVRGLLDALRDFWRDTLRQPDPGDLGAAHRRCARASRSSTTRAATADRSGPASDGAVEPGAHRRRRRPGSTATAACSASTPTTGSPASARLPARSGTARATVRQSWNDPLGLRRPGQGRAAVARAGGARGADRGAGGGAREIRAADGAEEAGLPGLELEVRALGVSQSYAALHESRASDLARAEAELVASRTREAALLDEISASRRELERVRAGDFGDPRAHIKHDHHPVPPGVDALREGRGAVVGRKHQPRADRRSWPRW